MLLVSKSGYAPVTRTLEIGPNALQQAKDHPMILYLPMIKEADDFAGCGVLSYSGVPLPLRLRAFRCNGEELKTTTVKDSTLQVCPFDTQTMLANRILEEGF